MGMRMGMGVGIVPPVPGDESIISQASQPGGVQDDQREGYQQPLTFRRVSQSGQVELKIEYLYLHIPTTLYLTELDTLVPRILISLILTYCIKNISLIFYSDLDSQPKLRLHKTTQWMKGNHTHIDKIRSFQIKFHIRSSHVILNALRSSVITTLM